MPAAVWDKFILEQNVDFTAPVYWDKEDGTPYDLTLWNARMQVKETNNSPALFTLTNSNGGIVYKDATGYFDIKMTAAQTALCTKNQPYLFDLVLTRISDGFVFKLLKGFLYNELIVTKND
jgi:hypothetical protein